MARNHGACSGCSLCLLACPVWRQTHDIRLTPHGRAKALQHGATPAELAASIGQCTLCGTCEPACPEDIPLVDLMLALRREAPLAAAPAAAEARAARHGGSLLLAGPAFDAASRERVAALLGCVEAGDPGADIALALECGSPVAPERIEGFLDGLRSAAALVVADGLLLRGLREWLPGQRIASLGEALSTRAEVRARLTSRDLYVIEPRAFHADHARLVRHYDALRTEAGCATNLDLQRLAIPTTANAAQRSLGLPAVDAGEQARWILEKRDVDRVVVEDPADQAVFAAVTPVPVVHLWAL